MTTLLEPHVLRRLLRARSWNCVPHQCAKSVLGTRPIRIALEVVPGHPVGTWLGAILWGLLMVYCVSVPLSVPL